VEIWTASGLLVEVYRQASSGAADLLTDCKVAQRPNQPQAPTRHWPARCGGGVGDVPLEHDDVLPGHRLRSCWDHASCGDGGGDCGGAEEEREDQRAFGCESSDWQHESTFGGRASG